MRDRQAGFTLMELMVTVAVIGILAAVAVPSFVGESRKTKAISEVQPMFNDLRVRLEQYMQENGKYPPSLDESTLHPSTQGTTQHALSPMPQAWIALKIRPTGNDKVYCGYTWVTGRPALQQGGADVGTVGPIATQLHFTRPATDWYYVLAKCDMDGNPAKFSYYLSSSVSPEVLKLDEGN